MERLDFDKIATYDYTDDFYKWHESQIREKFLSICLNDSTLSEEFKKHISNSENVTVELYPQYGYDIFLELGNVYVDYSYDYTFTCSTGATITGELTYNSSSNSYQASNVNVSKNYSSSDYTHHGNTAFYSSKYEKCLVHLGTARFNKADLKHYKNVKGSSNKPSELKALSERTIGYEDINKLLKVSSLPEEVQSKLKKRALEFAVGTNQRNFKFKKITDYRIEESSLTYLPSGCPFVISTTYKGKVYDSGMVKEVSDIKSFGEQSDHYNDYKERIDTLRFKYLPSTWATSKIYLTALLINIATFLIISIILFFHKALGHEAISHMWGNAFTGPDNVYKVFFVLLFISQLILLIISIRKKIAQLPEIRIKDVYSPKLTVSQLCHQVEQQYVNGRKEYVKKSVGYLIIAIIICGLTLGYAGTVWGKTDNPHFWYTPEIIGTYSYAKDDLTQEYVIEECDLEGNITLIFNWEDNLPGGWASMGHKGWYSAKSKYSGKIITKNNDEIVIQLKLVEKLKDPGFNTNYQEFEIEITKNFTKLKDKDYTHTLKTP